MGYVMTIRCLDAHGLPQPIYAVEVDGACYAPEEVAAKEGAHDQNT